MANNSAPSFLAGLGVGAILGLLIAPSRGSETREALRDAADEAVQQGQRIVEMNRQTWESAVEAGIAAYQRTVSDGD